MLCFITAQTAAAFWGSMISSNLFRCFGMFLFAKTIGMVQGIKSIACFLKNGVVNDKAWMDCLQVASEKTPQP